jgi:hypothetical protein
LSDVVREPDTFGRQPATDITQAFSGEAPCNELGIVRSAKELGWIDPGFGVVENDGATVESDAHVASREQLLGRPVAGQASGGGRG